MGGVARVVKIERLALSMMCVRVSDDLLSENLGGREFVGFFETFVFELLLMILL